MLAAMEVMGLGVISLLYTHAAASVAVDIFYSRLFAWPWERYI